MTSCNFENYNSSPSHPSVLRQSLNLNGILSKPASDSRMGQEDADFDKLAETHWCWSGVEPPQWISRSRSIRRRDKMFLAVKGYETFTYAENQFSPRQKQLWTGCVTYFDGWYLLTLNLKPWKALKCAFSVFCSNQPKCQTLIFWKSHFTFFLLQILLGPEWHDCSIYRKSTNVEQGSSLFWMSFNLFRAELTIMSNWFPDWEVQSKKDEIWSEIWPPLQVKGGHLISQTRAYHLVCSSFWSLQWHVRF